MATIPHIQIQTTPLVMEYRTKSAKLDMSTRSPEISMQRRPMSFSIEVVQPAKLTIDQTRAFEAGGLGGNEFFTKQIYSESKKIVLDAIAKKVADGNLMADFRQGLVIGDLHEGKPLEEIPFNYTPEPTYDMVDFNYQPKNMSVKIDPGELRIDAQVYPNEFKYTPAHFDAYVKQQNSVNIIPPVMNFKL